mgnify:CR=1 FL=1
MKDQTFSVRVSFTDPSERYTLIRGKVRALSLKEAIEEVRAAMPSSETDVKVGGTDPD